ncbi:MAG: precorrin-6A reductase [Ethanoligenens sp.]
MTEKTLVFAGTTEGRQLCEYLAGQGLPVTACVATEYGSIVMPEQENLRIHTGRLDVDEMTEFITGFPLVIDATHPYAKVVTRNIKEACKATESTYVRLLRPSQNCGDAVVLPDAEAAAAHLAKRDGNVLLTTGSKELSVFAGIDCFSARCYARVLPSPDAIEACREAGLSGRHIIAMQGPFSHQMNLAFIRETHARYLVTKDSGSAGGFAEKLSAAKEAGITVILIARPTEEIGLDFRQMTEWLNCRYGFEEKRKNRRTSGGS